MPNTQGTVYAHGVSNTWTNARVQSFSYDKAPANQASVVDEQGNVVSRHYDDLTKTGTAVLIYTASYTELNGNGGEVFAWNGETFEVTAVNKSEEAQGHRRMTISFMNSSNVTSA